MFPLVISEETSSVATFSSMWRAGSKRCVLGVLALSLVLGSAKGGSAESSVSATHAPKSVAAGKLEESYGKVPLSFEPNRGQTDGRVQFLSRGPGYGIFLTPGEAVLSFREKEEQSVLRMKLVGANASAGVEAEDKLTGTANYMKGTDRSKWATGVPTYGKVRYAGVYPGVDLVFYGNQRQLEYDFVVAPGRDAGKIALEFTGARPVVDAAGDLVLGVGGDARFHKPVVYQMVGAERVAVAADYEVRGQRVKFKLGRYDHSRELVIDPVVSYLTYLGGSLSNNIAAIAVDSAGATYITGSTQSTDFPLKNAYRSTFPAGQTTMFVTKLNQSGTSLVYSTYLASNDDTAGSGIAVDSSGSAYVVGFSDKAGFPVTPGAFQTVCGAAHDTNGNRVDGCPGPEHGVDSGVLAKLSADGSTIVYATYLSGSNHNSINAVAVDAAGEAYVTGQTNAYCGPGPYSATTTEPFECFPTTNGSVQSTTSIPSSGEYYYAFFTKFDAAGANLLYSSILGPDPSGAASYTNGAAVAVNANGIGFITGQTGNTLYTTDGSLQQNDPAGGNPAYVAAFDTNAGTLLYSTYLGGQNGPADGGSGIGADANGNAYITGTTSDCDFPTTTGAFETEAQYAPTDTANVGRCSAGFVAKLNPTGSALVWATYLNGAPLATGIQTSMQALALGADNSVYLAGTAIGTGYPVVNPVLPQGNTNTVSVVTHLSADGSAALFSSTLGGPVASATEYATAVAVDSTGTIYLAGNTNEQYLPTTTGVVQPSFAGFPGNGANNGFIAKISPSTPPSPSNGLTTNLLANPGAELGSIADWTAGGNGTPIVDTGAFDPGINPHTGSYDFVGARGTADSLSQTVSILTQGITAAQVDGGTLFANVSFWEQGANEGNPSDSGGVTLTFLDVNGATISTTTIGPEDSHDGTWANVTGIPAIPAGTRSITYTMNFVRNQESENTQAFIDDNVLSIQTNTGLTLFPATLHFGNVAVGSQSSSQTATVTNSQTTAITIAQVASELGANPTDFVQTNNCPTDPAVLAAGASCQITVTFVPDGVGPKVAGVDLPDDASPSDQFVRVDGTGTGGILQVSPGNLKTVAGNGTIGNTGDGGPATAAELNHPDGVAFDPSGNLYIADDVANVVRKVDTAGNITTFAGTGTGGFNGDGGLATQAELSQPFSVTSDTNGNIFIQDTGNYVIRKVDTNGIITTFAGTPGTPGHSGDGGPATAARFNNNQGARFDSAGNLYVPTCRGASIRKIDTAGNISTVAGNFTEGYSGDGGPATSAQLQCPSGVAIDAAGNLYIADASNNVIRKVNTAGIISTIAGSTSGAAGSSGDGGAATAALLSLPNDVALDSAGNLYIADSANNRVRRIDTSGIITTAAGGLNNAGSAAVNTPLGVTTDTAGNVYFSDSGNGKVQEIFPQGVQPFPPTTIGSSATAKTLTLTNIGNTDVALQSEGALTTSGNTQDFALSGGSCANGIPLTANGGSCTLMITFTPTAVGQRTLTVTIRDNALNTPQSFSIGGTGTAGAGTAVTPVITWATPAPITTATPLSATQLDAVATDVSGATVPGTYVYSPAAGTLLAAGTQTLSVTFTPTDTVNFTTATTTVQIVVTQATGGVTTTTTLYVTSGDQAVTAVAAGSVVILSAQVTTGDATVFPGQVAFCDASAANCTETHRLGVAQMTPGGTANYMFVPGVGAHSYKAAFLGTAGTNVFAGSASAAAPLTVTGTHGTATTITQSGAAGAYTLTATTVGTGSSTVALTGTVSFLDTSNANAVLGTSALGTSTPGFALAQATGSPDAVGAGTYGVATGDFNNDGFADVVVGNYSAGTVSVLLGKGDGTFLPRVTYAVGAEPERVLVADLNGDGALDLVVANTASSTISVLLGNGDGSFQAQVTYRCSSPVGLGVMDINHDGIPDVVAGDYYSNTMSVLLGNADGTLQTAVTYATGATPQTVAEGDFNGDGNVDVVVGNEGGATVGVFLGNGDGTFQAMVTYPVGNLPQGVQVGDFNADGKQDLAVTNQGDGTVSVLLGNGDGTFAAQVTYPVGVQPVGLAIADFNGDGIEDITVGNTGQASLTQGVLLGKGDGTFAAQVTFPTGNFPYGVAVADFNGDGLPDMAVANFADATATILLSQATETAIATVTGISTKGSGTDQVVASYPGDGNYGASVSLATGLTNVMNAPVITWTPAVGTIAYGTALGTSQLNATAATAAGVAIPGTFVYTPAAGTVLMPGTQTLSVVFTPTDGVDYTTARASVQIVVGGLALNSFTPTAALAASTDTKITLIGTGFVTTSVVMVNGTAVAAAYVNPTTLTAVIPAALLQTPGSLAVSVIDPSIGAVSVAQTFTVLPPTGAATLTGPATTGPGTQPTVTLSITNPYPLALTAQFNLAFASAGATSVDDPSIQFSSGGRTYSYTVAANSTSVPPVQLQAGTDAGTITITAKLMADDVDVTPTGLAPLVIVVPPVVPVISGTTITASGTTLTVVIHGFSNTREVSSAVFDFTAATGDMVATPTLTLPATTVFETWYGDATSVAYGSTFTYTQIFNTSSDASTVGSVKVTLTNSVGTSETSTSTGP